MSENKVNKFYKENSALIVVDMQNDFYVGGSLEVNGIQNILKPLKILIEKAILENVKIIFTKDNHPSNHISFSKWPKHCIKSTFGSLIIDDLNQYKKDLIVHKGEEKDIENYSCFFNGNDFSELKYFLENNKINNLYFCGVAVEYCVKFSALDAKKFNFSVFLIKNAICCIDKTFDLNLIDKEIKVI